MKLIPEAKQAWRMFSVQAQAAAIAILGVWQIFPDDLKAAIPHNLVAWFAMGLLALGIFGRLIEQPKVSG